MKKRKFGFVILVFLLVIGLVSCGTKEGVVSYNNYTSIVTVADNPTDQTTISTYNDVINLLGAATDYTNYDNTTGNGYVEWTGETTYVKVTFEQYKATAKEETGLYQTIYKTPIGEKTGIWEWIIKQLGYFVYYASNLFGLLGNTYYYWIGLLLMTLLVRTAAWPVYAKSNDLTLKMQIAQPEIDRIKQKYEGRNDQASQQRMQMETMDIYKKYKINFFGCLMPILQMPIFIAMYQVVQRFPLTSTSVFGDGSVVMNTHFLWTDLGNTAWLANLPLAAVVAITMFLSNWLMTLRQKKNAPRKRFQDPKAQSSQKSMQIFMYFMIVFMAYIALGNAGIAFYWIIGNSYQLFQSYVSHRQSGKRKEQLSRNM